jgi:hypothetical protein
MNLQNLSALALATVLTACVAPEPLQSTTHFSPAEVAWAKTRGTNSITGQSFLRQQGGGIVTCAGYEVDLVPQSSYASERINFRYGNTTKGYARTFMAPKLPPADPGYVESWHKTQCDAQGNFSITDLPDGDYYLITRVVWIVDRIEQGGGMMQRISLHGGEHIKVLLTNND